MSTPARKSTRATRAPERLAPSALSTPRKRTKTASGAVATPSRGRRNNASAQNQPDSDNSQGEEEEEEEEGDEDGDDDDAEASDSSASEASDFEENRQTARASKAMTPRKRAIAGTPQKRKSKQPNKRQPRQTATATVESQSVLLNSIMDENMAVGQVVMDWIESFRSGRESDAAVTELINFLLKLAGCPGQISEADLYETDSISDVLQGLQSQSIAALKKAANTGAAETTALDVDGGDDLLMGKSKEHRRFRKAALQFILKLLVDGQHHLVFADINEENSLSPFVEILLQWLVNMASSSYRPFRHVATLAALAVQSALVAIRAHTANALQTTHRQLETERTKRPGARRQQGETAQAQRLRDRVGVLTEQDELAEAAFKAFYNTVFVYRYRDVHATIRAECLVPLATWCRAYPAAYLNTEHLRYLGWALNDRDARVREAALAACLGPVLMGKPAALTPGSVGSGVGVLGGLDAAAEESVSEGFRPFIVRFLPRLVQMAAGDIDTRVQVAALKLVSQLGKLNYLDPNANIDRVGGKKGAAATSGRSTRAKGRKRPGAGSRGTYSHSLSQQLLEESGSESESDSEADTQGEAVQESTEPSDLQPGFIDIQPLYSDKDAALPAGVLPSPHHSTMRYLAPLVAHTHATVRAAAADLVTWWLNEDWIPAAASAVGIAATPDEGSKEYVWLLYKCLGAFLCHLACMSQPTADQNNDGQAADSEDAVRLAWVAEQAAACIEEAWHTPTVGVAATSDEQLHAVLAGSLPGGMRRTALDHEIEAAAGANTDALLPRPAAAAQVLWPRLPQLNNLESLAQFLCQDHSAAANNRETAAYALAAAEETALLQALAVWVVEVDRASQAKGRRMRGGKKDKSESDDAAQALARVWQSSFVSLLTRNLDNATRLVPLMYLASEQLDPQLLFDAQRVGVLEDVARITVVVLERYGGNLQLARLAIRVLTRLDSSGLLGGASSASYSETATPGKPGELIAKAAHSAATLLAGAVASVPETLQRAAHRSAYADVHACLVPLRAMIHASDVSAQLSGASAEASDTMETDERPADAAIEQVFALLDLAAKGGELRTVPEKVALCALHVAYHYVLWSSVRLDASFRGLASHERHEDLASGEPLLSWNQVESACSKLCDDRDRIVDLCAALVDGSADVYGRLRESAFAHYGHLMRLFTGHLTYSVATEPDRLRELRRKLKFPRDVHAVRLQLTRFFERRLASWASILGHISQPNSAEADERDAAVQLYMEAPSSWSIAYARICALSATWAEWLENLTMRSDSLAVIAGYTGILGLEGAERRRLEQQQGSGLADGANQKTRAASKRKVGFVALSAFDHIVQVAVDALKPELVRESTRGSVMQAYVAAMQAAYERYVADPETIDAVNVGTLARFIGSALKNAFASSSGTNTNMPATPARGGRGGEPSGFVLAPANVGAAWAGYHETAIDFILRRVAPELLSGDTSTTNMLDSEAAEHEREPMSSEQWDKLVAPWFVALAQTVSGVLRPRHAERLDQHLQKRMSGTLGQEDAAFAVAAVQPYQRALDKELAKMDAIRARMAETHGVAMQSMDMLSSPPMSPMPAPRTSLRPLNLLEEIEDDAAGMDVDAP
ncbi:cohesin complex subunit [Coemansia sp. Benny D115]|nr:cohesin complex subunit [Coemansia sp. Benny D115]